MTHDKQPQPHSHSELHREEGGSQGPYWKRAHHDWKFWIALGLMLTAMGVYITTLDLSVVPGPRNQEHIQQPLP